MTESILWLFKKDTLQLQYNCGGNDAMELIDEAADWYPKGIYIKIG